MESGWCEDFYSGFKYVHLRGNESLKEFVLPESS